MFEWNVFVEGVGNIGTINEEDESSARVAAWCHFEEEGERGESEKHAIFEGDKISVFRRY